MIQLESYGMHVKERIDWFLSIVTGVFESA